LTQLYDGHGDPTRSESAHSSRQMSALGNATATATTWAA
jgi:hypothetical protein